MSAITPTILPKGTNFSVHTAERLTEVAAEINDRLRKSFGWERPANLMGKLLQGTE